MKYIVKYCNIVNASGWSFDTLERAQQAEEFLRTLADGMLTRIVVMDDDEVEEVPLEAEPPEEQHISWWEKFKRLLMSL